MSSKQDRSAARTAADLERKYKFGTSFAEAMGLAEDARKLANEKIGRDENEQVVRMINAVANQVTITSDNFKLDADGKITSTAGEVGGWNITNDELSKFYLNQSGDKYETILRAGFDGDAIHDAASVEVLKNHVPVCYIRPNGEFYSGEEKIGNAGRGVQLKDGVITVNGDFRAWADGWSQKFEVLRFKAAGKTYSLYVDGELNVNDDVTDFTFKFTGMSVEEYVEQGETQIWIRASLDSVREGGVFKIVSFPDGNGSFCLDLLNEYDSSVAHVAYIDSFEPRVDFFKISACELIYEDNPIGSYEIYKFIEY